MQSAGRETQELGPGAVDGQPGPRPLVKAARWAGILLLLVFYLTSLGGPSLIADEADFANSLIGFGKKPWRERPVLFLYLEQAVVGIAGPTETNLRLFPCLAAIAAVIATYAIARRELGEREAVAASALLAIGPTFLFHAHLAKHYTFEALFTCLLIWTYLRYRQSPGARAGALYAGVALLSFGFSFTSGSVIAAILVIEAWRARSRRRDLAKVLALHLFLGAALAAVYLAFHVEEAGGWLKRYWVECFPPAYGPVELATWTIRKTLALAVGLSGFPSGVAALLCAAAGGVAATIRGRPTLAVIGTVAVGAHWMGAVVGLYPYGEPRLVLDLAPLVALMIGAGLALLVPRRGASPASYLALIGVLYMALYPAVGQIKMYARGGFESENIRDLVREIHRNRGPDDCTWVCDGASYAYRYYWYRFTGAKDRSNVVWGATQRVDPTLHRPLIEETAARCERVYVLFSHDPIGELDWIKGYFSIHYDVEAAWPGRGVWLGLYRRRAHPMSEDDVAAMIAELHRSAGPLDRAP